MAIVLDGTAGEQLSGNLTFTSTATRITGDMSNATISNRLSFQTSTTNDATRLQAIPNGTGNISQMSFFGSSDPNNSSFVAISLSTGAGNANIQSGASGTGTFLPLALYTNNTAQMTIATDGTITGTKGNLQLISGTAVASTSGTSITFTGIPSWAKRITVMLNGVSTSGTSLIQMQLGSGSATTSGYISASVRVGANPGNTSATSGILLVMGLSATDNQYGTMVISNLTGNTWTASGIINQNSTNMNINQGQIALGGTLDRIIITTVNGTDTFDAGSINIMYE